MSREAGESRWSKGRDGLKKTGPRQLSLVFADSPSGGGSSEPSDASERRSFLLHKARTKKTTGSAARKYGPSCRDRGGPGIARLRGWANRIRTRACTSY